MYVIYNSTQLTTNNLTSDETKYSRYTDIFFVELLNRNFKYALHE